MLGFYLPWCRFCDPAGDETLEQWLPDALAAAHLESTSAHALPEALQLGPDWFDGDRLLLGALPKRAGGSLHEWKQWPPPAHPGKQDPADVRRTHPSASATSEKGFAVRVAPTVTTLAGVILAANQTEAQDLPNLLRADPRHWTWRSGSQTQLNRLLCRPGTPSTPSQTRKLPPHATWAALYVKGQPIGPATRNLDVLQKQARQLLASSTRIEFRYLTAPTAATYGELRYLSAP